MEWATNHLGCGTAEGEIVVHLPTKIKEYIIPLEGKKSKASKE